MTVSKERRYWLYTTTNATPLTVFPRGRLDNLGAKDIYLLAQSNRFYLNQVTWLWASCATESGSSPQFPMTSDNGSQVGGMNTEVLNNIVHASPRTMDDSQSQQGGSSKGLLVDEVYWFNKSQEAALQILTALDKMENEELTLSQDFVYVSASKVSLWLSRYNMWFSASFLQDTRSIMTSLLQRCMVATSRRGNTLRCFARLMDAIIQCLSPASTAEDHGQHPPAFSGSLREQHYHSQPAPVPTMFTEADAGILRPLRNPNTRGDNIPLQSSTWPQNQHPTNSTYPSSNVPALDLGHFLDVEDLRHWEELLGLDLQLGQIPNE